MLARAMSCQVPHAAALNRLLPVPARGFKQVNNLHEIIYTAQAELAQRTEKYLERTDKVYKPS